MRRLWILPAAFTGVLLVFGALALWGLPVATRKAFAYLEAGETSFGLDVSGAAFRSAHFSSWRSLAWRGVSADMRVLQKGVADPRLEFGLSTGEVELRVESFATGLLSLSIEGIRAAPKKIPFTSALAARPDDRLDGHYFYLPFSVEWFDPLATTHQVRAVLRELSEILKKGPTLVPLEFVGKATFRLGDRLLEAGLRTQRLQDRVYLTMDPRDLRAISKQLSEELTEAEVEFLSLHPLQTPTLLRIRDHAQATAREAHGADPSVPEDAYRHVLWSYLLTREFDERFAKEATDAHELGGSPNASADRDMDLWNNEMGRRYALSGIEEPGLLRRILEDPNVIRSPIGKGS